MSRIARLGKKIHKVQPRFLGLAAGLSPWALLALALGAKKKRGWGWGWGHSGGQASRAFLIYDDCNDARAAGAVHNTPATPGPGTRTVIDTGSSLSIASGAVVLDGNRVGFGDPGLWYDAIARATGVALFQKFNRQADVSSFRIGLSNSQTGQLNGLGFRVDTNAALVGTTSVSSVTNFALNTDYWAVTILRSAGGFVLTSPDGQNWKLAYPTLGLTTTPMYPGLTDMAGSQAKQYSLRVVQLAAPWNTDYGIATQRLAGARSPGDTFTHEADCILEYEADALPTNNEEIIDFRFRIQDATNYWQLTIDDDGDLGLNEVVAGVPTSRGTDAAHVAAGDRIVIICDDEEIKVYEANLHRITYANAANFKTATSGELEALAAGSAVKDIISWPRTMSGAAKSQLELYAA